MAAYVKYQDYAEQLSRGRHDWGSHTFKAALTNAAPNVATHVALADITQLSTGGGYTGGAGGGLTLDTVTLSETGGTAQVTIADEVFVASGAAVGPFRYVVMYNDTPTTPIADPLVAYWDYGSALTLADTESFTIDFTGAVWTLA